MTTTQKYISTLAAFGMTALFAQATPLAFSENFDALATGDLDSTVWTATNWNVVDNDLDGSTSGKRIESTAEGYASISLGDTFTDEVWLRLDYRSSGQTNAGPFFSTGLTDGLVTGSSGRNNSVSMNARGSSGDTDGFRGRVAGADFASSGSRDQENVGTHSVDTIYTLVMRASKSDPSGNYDTGTFWLDPDLSGGVTSLTGGVSASFDTGIDEISHVWVNDDGGGARRYEIDNIEVYAIPEPGTLVLLGGRAGTPCTVPAPQKSGLMVHAFPKTRFRTWKRVFLFGEFNNRPKKSYNWHYYAVY